MPRMRPNLDESEGAKRKSSIACHSCRRRKVKCDREMPSCQVCQTTHQECQYPDRQLKPGPKIGSFQRPRRHRKGQARSKIARSQRDYSNTPSSSEEACDDKCDGSGASDDENGTSPGDPRPAADPQGKSLSKGVTGDASTPKTRLSVHMNDLSFILHPSHETATPDEFPENGNTQEESAAPQESMYQQALRDLSMSEAMMEKLIQIYFESMVFISLFHEPQFRENVNSITSSVQLSALLSAITGFSVRFLPLNDNTELDGELQHIRQRSTGSFTSLALRLVDQALFDCGDEPPPLCVLQALIIATHCQLTQGVHGRAWRSLGMCINLAYELNFHLLDSKYAINQNVHFSRQEDEEKRRAWWAIWEMDVFASTIRRTPPGISWTQMEVLLPIPDEDWYSTNQVRSCFFEQDPGSRWRSLVESGNKSAKAWFIVINSIMKDAQTISCPRGVPCVGQTDKERPSNSERFMQRGFNQDSVEYPRQKLESLANSVQCLARSLPEYLRFRQQHLGFEARQPGQLHSNRKLHCSIYNIYVMIQLARLMIFRYDIFSGQIQFPHAESQKRRLSRVCVQENPSVRQYFEAADNILRIVNCSSEEHVQYINPFLLSTIWLAAAVQLVRKHIAGPSVETSLIKSRFDVLYLTYKECVTFWDTKTAMQQNLELIEARLEGEKTDRSNPDTSICRATPSQQARMRPFERRSWTPLSLPFDSNSVNSNNGRPSLLPQQQTNQNEVQRGAVQISSVSSSSEGREKALETPPTSVVGERIALDTMSTKAQSSPTLAQAMSQSELGCLDSLTSTGENNSAAGQDHHALMGDIQVFDSMQMTGPYGQQTTEVDWLMKEFTGPSPSWKDFDMPSEIHDLLSGFSTY